MASVTFPEALGGNGQTYTDDADPDTGLDGLGYTVRFIPCLQQAVVMGLSAQSNALACADYVQQCQTLREAVGNDRLAVAADRQHVSQQKDLVDAAAMSAAQSAASVNAENIVHKPGSGLPNAAGEAYSREVVGGAGGLMAEGAGNFLTSMGGSHQLPGGAGVNDADLAPSYTHFYPVTAGTLNGPGYSGSVLRMQRGGSTFTELGIVANSAGNTSADIRSGVLGGDTGRWIRLFSRENILGSVSQIGGVPTGAIIERGSNANGSYTLFADGFMRCVRTGFTVTRAASNRYQGFWNFPRSFASKAYVGVNLGFSGDDYSDSATRNNISHAGETGNGGSTGIIEVYTIAGYSVPTGASIGNLTLVAEGYAF